MAKNKNNQEKSKTKTKKAKQNNLDAAEEIMPKKK